MGSPLPEDPYLALGLPKDASAATIKTTYRKLVLKFHPDKVQDDALKQAAVDQFHKIQTAYEIVGDEDRRQRYDAQCKLAELRKDVMEKQGSGARSEVRTAAYKMPTDSAKGGAFYARGPERMETPLYEERRPSGYANTSPTDYFDTQRASSKKDSEYERSSSKHASPRDDRERSRSAAAKDAKENERARQRERDSRRERDVRRDRDRKTAYVVEESGSSEDEYERQARRMNKEDELRRARGTYHDQARRDKEDAARGYYDTEERARKLYAQYDGAREYMQQSGRGKRRSDDERRPSPPRMASSKDKLEYIKRDGRPSVMVRRGSGRPSTAGRDTEERRAAGREGERRSSVEEQRKPPPLTTTKSSPADILPAFEKQRSQSVQVDAHDKEDFVAPKFRRSETMPSMVTRESRRKEPQKGSSLRQTEIVDGYATPSVTPEYNSTSPNKYRYQQEYADDHEYPTPDGYRTEVREPTGASKPSGRYTRSPSPMRERERDRARAASARYPTASPQRPAPLPRTTSTSYVYTPGQGVETYSRPNMTRENSRMRDPMLYGEVPTTARDTRSPRQTQPKYSPPPEGVRYQKEIRPEDIRVASGYGSKRPSAATRPSYSRSGSNYKPVYAN